MIALRVLPNIITSVFRFLNDEQYTVGADTRTLKQFFPGLMIFPAYPDDLTVVKTPVLALGGTELTQLAPDLYGSPGFETVYRLPLYGFVCGQGSDQANKAYRDKLMSDLVELLGSLGSNEGFALYDADTKAVIGELETVGVSGRVLPVNAPTVEVDRYKFLVETDVAYSG